MGENSINSIEVQSHVTATSGYYFTKKSGDAAVNSEVTMEKIDEDGIWQGTFSVTVLSADRWLGDMKPGIIASSSLKTANSASANEPISMPLDDI